MEQILNRTIGECIPDKLISDTKHPLDASVVAISTGQKVIKRGTVLKRNTDESYVVLGSNESTGKANCVVSDDTDTGETEGDVTGVPVYISGSFNSIGLIAAENYTLTQQDIQDLRDSGIFVK